MIERTPTYSTNPDDYKYDANTEHLRHIPGVGVYKFHNDDQNIDQQVNQFALSSDLKYNNLHLDTPLLNTFKRFYKRVEGEDFVGTDQEAVDEFMSKFAHIDNNLSFGLGKVVLDQSSLSEEDKLDVGMLYDRYIRTDSFGEGSRPWLDQTADVAGAFVTDPFNYLGIFTGGLAFAGRAALGKVAGQAAKKAIIDNFRKSVIGRMGINYAKTTVKYPITVGAIQGAGWGSLYDIEKQNVEIDSGMREIRHNVTGEPENFKYDDLLLTAVIGTGFGGAFGAGAKALSKFFSKGSYSNILGKDRTQSTTDELREELQSQARARAIAGGSTPAEADIIASSAIEDPSITIDKKDIDKTNRNFNKTEEDIRTAEIEQRISPRTTKMPEHSYPLNWVNDAGETIDVTVSNKTTSRASPEAPEVTEVTLRGRDGVEYNVIANEQGGLTNPTRQFKSDDTMRNILDELDIQQLGTPTGVMRKAHEFLVKNFTSHFGLGPETAERMRDAERVLIASGEKIDILIKRFEKAWKTKHRTSFDKVGRDVHQTFIKALTTNDAKRDQDVKDLLPKGSELKSVVDEWRSLISETSRDLMESGAFSKYQLKANGQPMLDDAGNPIKNTFFETLQKRELEKTYLHRMYSIYEDPEYVNKSLRDRLGDDYDTIRDYFMDLAGVDDLSAAKMMEEIAIPSTDRKLGQLGPLGKSKIRIEKVDNKYVKMLLGEITDPRQLFAGTVFKTKKIVEDYKFKRDLVSIGLRRGTGKRPVMARTGMSGDWKRIEQGSRSFELNDEQLSRMWNREAKELLEDRPAPFMDNPFDGIFVDPEYKRYYDVMGNFYSQGKGILSRITAGSTFAFNLSHTVLSPTTHMRNFIGGMLQNAYNAILPMGSRAWIKAVASSSNIEGSPTYSVFRRTVPMFNKFKKRGALDDGDVDSITRLIELGVVHNGMRAGIFKEAYNIMIKDANPLHHLERKLLAGKGKGTLVKTVDKLSELYEMSDNINKISAFESEFAWLFRAFGDGSNSDAFIKHASSLGVFDVQKRINAGESISRLIEEAAAKKVNMFTPSYSQLTGSSRLFRAVPIGNFVAFPMEVTRNYTNSWRLAAREIRSGSAAMRARGSMRAAALAGASGITVGGIGGFSAALNGITDDQREALESKDLSARWLQGTNFFYTDKFKKNTLTAIPLAYTDPFSYLSRIAQVAMHSFNENEADAILNSRLINASSHAFVAAMDPYIIPAVGPTAIAKVFSELSASMIDGKELDSEFIERELRNALYPTIYKDFERIYKQSSLNLEAKEGIKVTKWGTEVDPMWYTMLGWVSGMKPQNIHIPSRVGFALVDANRERGIKSKKWTDYIGNPQNWAVDNYEENIIEKYKEHISEEKEVARRVRNILGHGRTLGLTPGKLTDLATSFSKEIEVTKAGPKKYRANFAGAYISELRNNRYPLKFIQGKTLETIKSSLRNKGIDPLSEGSLFRKLSMIMAEEFKDIKIGD